MLKKKSDYIGFWEGTILSPERAATYQPRASPWVYE
jgi:hypothetical protein